MKSKTAYAPYILRQEWDQTTAKCIKCLCEKSPQEYYKHSVRTDGFIRFRQICKDCRRKKERKNRARPIHTDILKSGIQKCKYCNIEKPVNLFYSNGCFSDGTKKYRTRCKDCVLLIYKTRHKETYAEKIFKKHSSPKNYISTLLNHCSKRGKNGYNLDIQYLLDLYDKQNGNCNISGIKMTYKHGQKSTNISIDRIDSTKGYTKENVHLVCYIVNIMKSYFTLDEFIDTAKKIVWKSSKQPHGEDLKDTQNLAD